MAGAKKREVITVDELGGRWFVGIQDYPDWPGPTADVRLRMAVDEVLWEPGFRRRAYATRAEAETAARRLRQLRGCGR